MAKEILVEIKVAGSDELVKSRQAIVGLQKDIKDLEGVDQKAAEQKKIALKAEQDNYRQLQKEVKAEKTAIEGATDTLAKKRAELSKMNKELENTAIGSESFKKLTAESKKLRAEINGVDQEAGKFNGNVGNYKNSIIDAFSAMGINVSALTGNLSKANSAIQMTNVSIKGVNTSLRITQLILTSLGIGAILLVLGLIVNYLANTQEGMDKVRSVLVPLGNVFQRVLGVVQELGKALFSIFTFDFANGFKQLGSAFDGFGGKIKQAWKEGERLAQIIKEIDRANLDLAENEDRINKEIAAQNLLLTDSTASYKERQEAGRKLLQLEDELLAKRIVVAKLEAEQARIKADQNDTDDKAKIELAKKQAAIDKLIGESDVKRKKARDALNTLEKEIATNQKKAADERLKQLEAETEATKKLNLEKQKATIEQVKKDYDEEALLLKVSLANKRITQEEYNEQLKTVQRNQFTELLALYQQFDLDTRDLTIKRSEFESDLLIKQNEEDEKKTKEQRERRIKFLEELQSLERIQAEAFIELQKTKIDAAVSFSNALGGLVDQEGAIGKVIFLFQKALAIASVIKSGALAKAQIAANLFAIPPILPPGIPNPAYPIALAAALTQTSALKLRQVASIAEITAQAIPSLKFARGVIGVQGPGTSKSDSIDAKISRYESVMTAEATMAFAPMLARMEEAVGNKPNYQLGPRRFAGGIIGVPNVDIMGGTERIIRQTIEAIGSIPVVVAEGDITSTQNRVARIKTQGDL